MTTDAARAPNAHTDGGTMAGKTVLVTGATSGIGREAALALARMGARVLLVGRDRAKTEGTATELKARTGNFAVEVLLADLSRPAEVRRLAREVRGRTDRLDVLVNNAGAYFQERTLTPDGLETTFAVNHLAYFVLTLDLLDLLKATPGARIVNVASAAEAGGRLEWDNLQGERRWNGQRAYATSKLENLLFTYALSRRLAGTDVTVNALHPGLVNSNFAGEVRGPIGTIFALLKNLFGLSPQRGAETIVFLASSPLAAGVNGGYWEKSRRIASSKRSHDEAAQEKLWRVSEELAGRTA